MHRSPVAAPAAVFALAALLSAGPAAACTNFIVTPGASTDGSAMVVYTCDGEFHPRLRLTPAADHEPGTTVRIEDWKFGYHGDIPQVPHTYGRIYNAMNEHQVVIGETTVTGREELRNPDGYFHYWVLMGLALERARTAREAIEVMAGLVAEHGYCSTGESFSIADPHEAWIMEMYGPGPGGEGALWVALRVPDGMVCAHANLGRIGEFPRDDPANCLYADNVIDFAVERGYWDPDAGEPFRFNDAYCPATPQSLRYCATRVWSLFRRCAPSRAWPPDYHRGVPGAEPDPLWIEPDEKISLADVFDLIRDHYEGTDFDMTVGVDAGPYGTPNRWRPMTWELDGAEYSWERPISTQQTGFSFVSQSRAHLPDPIGGVVWYGVDDTSCTCYVPLYCGIREVPRPYTVGSLQEFTWESAWWVFNFVSNYANLKYSYMIEDIRTVQAELEGGFLTAQPAIEAAAVQLAQTDPERLHTFLTEYSVGQGERVVRRWRELGEELLVRYNDGYVKDAEGTPQEVGYPETWLRAVETLRPETFRLERESADSLETALPY